MSLLDSIIDAIEGGHEPWLVFIDQAEPVIPAPEANNGCPPGRWGKGRRHGYVGTYGAGCRCDLCRAARRAAVRRYKLARSGA